MIDENNPEVIITGIGDLFKKETWTQFIYFLERKQFLSNETMTSRMFYRRGQFFNQFINHKHMGFGGYMAVQFFNFKDMNSGEIVLGSNAILRILKLSAYLSPLTIALWAISYMFKRNRNGTLLLGLGFITCTLFLVFYMNFADGTVPEQRDLLSWQRTGAMGPKPGPAQLEVRERDYFFTPGFMFLGMWAGIGLACLMHCLLLRFKNPKKYLAPAFCILMLASPALPLYSNMGIKTRAGNWVAYDYGFNLLQSCEKDAILFTGGDNDTFPLWFAQEVAGIRRDVRVVNLSLVNTSWYIGQLMGNAPSLHIPPVLFDEYFRPRLASRQVFLDSISHRFSRLRQAKKVLLSKWKLEITIPDNKAKRVFRVQDYMVLNIIHGNAGKRSIYFANTVPESAMMGLKNYLCLEGMVYKLGPQRRANRVNIEKTLYNLDNIYRFTNLGKKDLFLNNNVKRTISNYRVTFLSYIIEDSANLKRLRAAHKSAKADHTFKNIRRQLNRWVSIMPADPYTRLTAARVYAQNGRMDLAIDTLEKGLIIDPLDIMYNANLGFMLKDTGKFREAIPFLEMVVYHIDTDFSKLRHRETVGAIQALMDLYQKTGKKDKYQDLLEQWVDANPQDRRAREELDKL
jgi:hypothetical protein